MVQLYPLTCLNKHVGWILHLPPWRLEGFFMPPMATPTYIILDPGFCCWKDNLCLTQTSLLFTAYTWSLYRLWYAYTLNNFLPVYGIGGCMPSLSLCRSSSALCWLFLCSYRQKMCFLYLIWEYLKIIFNKPCIVT